MAIERQDALVNPKYQDMIKQTRTYLGDLEGAHVLDIGCDIHGDLVKSIAGSFNIAHVTGINPLIKKEVETSQYSLKIGDARNLQFADNTFDHIVSLAGFEHFYDLDKSLAELYRVLKPGGMLYTVFGPIWSSCWGHHLWLYHNGEVYNYKQTFLPPFCHLIMTEAAFKKQCKNMFPDEELLNKVTKYVYHSDEQNRLFFSDYEQITYESPFDVLFFVGHKEVPYKDGYSIINYKKDMTKLAKNYSNKKGFGYSVITMLLGK